MLAAQKAQFGVKIFADGADKKTILEMSKNPLIAGFTTNPTLMKKAGIQNYKSFAQDILSEIKNKPFSFEVFADEFPEMERQAMEIASWAENVYIKIPITNTKGQSTVPLIKKLSFSNVKINVTAMMTFAQTQAVVPALCLQTPAYISIFAGRVADSGIDPLPLMKQIVEYVQPYPNIEVIWASPREVFNVVQADQIGCHVITVTDDIIKKLASIGKNLDQFSLETVKMFYTDAQTAGFSL